MKYGKWLIVCLVVYVVVGGVLFVVLSCCMKCMLVSVLVVVGVVVSSSCGMLVVFVFGIFVSFLLVMWLLLSVFYDGFVLCCMMSVLFLLNSIVFGCLKVYVSWWLVLYLYV